MRTFNCLLVATIAAAVAWTFPASNSKIDEVDGNE